MDRKSQVDGACAKERDLSRWLINEMEMSLFSCEAASFFCANGLLSWLKIEQRQLNDAFHPTNASGPRLCWGFPVEQPVTLIQVKER